MAEKTYNILNYTTSPVALIIGRNDSILIEAGSDDEPTIYPLTEAEILYANNTTDAFKSGILRFEPEYEEELYDLCRIRNWKEIMTNKQIEDIFVNFNREKFISIFSITNPSYFNRIYGIFIGLRNAGLSVPKNVEQAMVIRYKELANGVKHTKIVLTPKDTETVDNEVDELKKEIESLKKIIKTDSTTPTRKTTARKTTKAKETDK